MILRQRPKVPWAQSELERRLRRYDQGDDAGRAYHRQVHRTAIHAWLRIFEAAGARADPREFDAFVEKHPRFLDPDYLRRHFSARLLRQRRARTQAVSPDREPLPWPGELLGGEVDAASRARLLERDRRRAKSAALWRSWLQVSFALSGFAVGGVHALQGLEVMADTPLIYVPILVSMWLLAPPSVRRRSGPPTGRGEALAGVLLAVPALAYQVVMVHLGYALRWVAPLVYLASLATAYYRVTNHAPSPPRPLPAPPEATTVPRPPRPAPPRAAAEIEVLAAAPAAPSAADATCPFCADPLGNEPTATCPDCHTPHHEDCWQESGDCTTYGCRGARAF